MFDIFRNIHIEEISISLIQEREIIPIKKNDRKALGKWKSKVHCTWRRLVWPSSWRIIGINSIIWIF